MLKSYKRNDSHFHCDWLRVKFEKIWIKWDQRRDNCNKWLNWITINDNLMNKYMNVLSKCNNTMNRKCHR